MRITREFLESINQLMSVKSTEDVTIDWKMIFEKSDIDLEEQKIIASALLNAQDAHYLSVETIKKIASFFSVDSNLFFWMDKESSINSPANKQRIVIAERIIRKRQSLGYSTKDLALISGISRATLTNLETGKKDLTINNLLKIMFALNLRPMDVFAFEEDLLYFNSFKEYLLNHPENFVQDLRRLSNDLNNFLVFSGISETVEQRDISKVETPSNVNSKRYMQESAEMLQEDLVGYQNQKTNQALQYLGTATVLSGALLASIAVPTTAPVFGGLLLMELIKRKKDE